MAKQATDVRAKTPDELGTMLLDLRKEQFNLRFQRATGQLEGVGQVRKVRRDIARVMARQIEAARSVGPVPPPSAHRCRSSATTVG